ncbi:MULTISPECIES: polyphosphate--glucose phosphotransferase [Kocuria]|uniref:ROK family protein n=2 Tax=Kocuria TaxID=57493 RepID=A0ABP8WTP9_9MICC|nr:MULTISPECIES: ROK family protein [Kocuria]MDO5367822.1 ROK family protein [Kocuria sp.]PBB07938.1 polyphosphate glucokinase [Kocuria sp. WRN011]
MSPTNPSKAPSTLGIGVDIGGTGTKGGIVDLRTGELVGDRFRIPTPKPATPEAVATVVKQIVDELQSRPDAPAPDSHVGIVFPAIIKDGVALSAANVDKSWINTNVDALMTETLGREVEALNDADGAGLAEAYYGAGRDKTGLVMVITLGTGIGSAMILNGQLVPNAELGHLEIDGHDAETQASAAAREREDLPWKKWAKKRLQRYFSHVEFLFSPSLFIIGGGVSKNSEKFVPYLDLKTPVEIASLRNNAGIVGAALWAQQCRDAQAAKAVIDPEKK